MLQNRGTRFQSFDQGDGPGVEQTQSRNRVQWSIGGHESALFARMQESRFARMHRPAASAGCREVFKTHLQCRLDDKRVSRECKNRPIPAQVGCIPGSFPCTIQCTNGAPLTTIEPSCECRNSAVHAQAGCSAGCREVFATHLQCRLDDKRVSRKCKNGPIPAQVGCIPGSF